MTSDCAGCERQTLARGVDLWAVARLTSQPRSRGKVGGDLRVRDGGDEIKVEVEAEKRMLESRRRRKQARCGGVEIEFGAAGHVTTRGGGGGEVTGANKQAVRQATGRRPGGSRDKRRATGGSEQTDEAIAVGRTGSLAGQTRAGGAG